jgi:hypothetical protein
VDAGRRGHRSAQERYAIRSWHMDAAAGIPAGSSYVAIGDSFQSGEGALSPNYYAETDISGTNQCHRARTAYPAKLVGEGYVRGLDLKFWACSGAVIDSLSTKTNTNGAAPGPKSGCAGMTLYAILRLLQRLLVVMAGACHICNRPFDDAPSFSDTT